MTKINLEKIDYSEKYRQLAEKRWLNPLLLKELTGWSLSWQSKARMSSNKMRLPFKKIGKFVIYDRYEIDAFIEKHTVVGGE
ncbi:MAG: hypothetical protein PHF17_01570 [Arcobacteraceae bacterium]|nr:hypothetical protein [Arcobacteraceae bacterium]